MAVKKKSSSQPAVVAVPFEWRVGEEVVARAATNLTVQCNEHEATLSFFEARVPVVLGTPEEVAAVAMGMTSIPVVCVARVMFAASRLQEIAEALRVASENYQKMKEAMAGMKPSDGATK
jgi:hypothetical protein